MEWFVGLTGLVSSTLISTWLLGFLNVLLPSPERASLAVRNCLGVKSPRSDDRFRFVLCWLKNDRKGKDTDMVAQAFTSVQGVTLVRSARVAKAPGAADDWRPAMRRNASAVLERWDADLALVGLIKQPGEVLSLWFIPRAGEGTLGRGDRPYRLEEVTLGEDFHDDLHARLTVLALAAVAPLSKTETRGRVLEEGLTEVSEKLATLLEGCTFAKLDRRAALHVALGNALQALGEREPGTERLEQAVRAYRAALEELARERVPLDWAATQNNLGAALCTLGERERGTERLEQAVAVYCAALEEYTRERVPLDWAMTQNNLANVLQALGKRESGTERLEQAVAAYCAALEEYTRERVPLDWAMRQNNLANVLQALGKRESGTERLEQAVAAYCAALEEYTRERVPLDWAMTQHNLGAALTLLGEREGGTERLEQAVAAFRAALEESTRERVPLDWAATQHNLGAALQTLGKRESGTERLEQAVAAYGEALKERTRERVPLDWAATQNNLGNALGLLGEREGGTERLEQAVAAYGEALEERTRERAPLDWAATQNNLGNALARLVEDHLFGLAAWVIHIISAQNHDTRYSIAVHVDLPPRVVPHPMLAPAPVEGREVRASSGTRATA